MDLPEWLRFDRVVVISLERDQQRLQRFFTALPSDWSFLRPEPWQAVDGSKTTAPEWWPVCDAGWGCFQSHLGVIQQAMNDGIESIFIFEDDAVFSESFGSRLNTFAAELPQDWEWIYFGGQHLQRELGVPAKVTEHVYRPYNVHRAHAYGLRGRKVMRNIYHHLLTRENWGAKHHYDHRLGELHHDYEGGVYVPDRWLVGQASGYSNIKQKNVPTNFFMDTVDVCSPFVHPGMIAVVGANTNATRTIAGMLQLLGVSMGGSQPPKIPWEGPSHYCAPGLETTCHQLFSPRWWAELTNFSHRVAHLKAWANQRQTTKPANNAEHSIGACHPLLSIMPEEIHAAWPGCRLIICLDGSTTAETGWGTRQQRWMQDCLPSFDERSFPNAFRFIVEQMRSESFVADLTRVLGISPAPRQLAAAENMRQMAQTAWIDNL